MSSGTRLRRRWLFTIIGFILIIDQWTKILARGPLQENGPLTFLGGWVRFDHVENPGAFMSFGAQWPPWLRQALLHGGVVVVLLFLTYLLWRHRYRGAVHGYGLMLILAGGVGNLIDRLMKGTVTDFMILGQAWLRTGVFNVADFAIVLGLIGLIWPEPKSVVEPT